MSTLRFVPFMRRFIPFRSPDSSRTVALSTRGRFGAQAAPLERHCLYSSLPSERRMLTLSEESACGLAWPPSFFLSVQTASKVLAPLSDIWAGVNWIT
jgi:hypothetical protein